MLMSDPFDRLINVHATSLVRAYAQKTWHPNFIEFQSSSACAEDCVECPR